MRRPKSFPDGQRALVMRLGLIAAVLVDKARDCLTSGGEFFFQTALVGAAPRKTVHSRAMQIGRLRRRYILRFTSPGLQRRLLQGAAKGKTQLPGVRAQGVHGVQVLGRRRLALTTGEESNARHRRRHMPAHRLNGLLRGLRDRRLLRTLAARGHNAGFQDHSLQTHPLKIELLKDHVQRFPDRLAATLDRMRALHQHFGSTMGTKPASWLIAA